VEPTHRSIHPNIPGVPWWAALVIAITTTAIGYAVDAGSGHKELTHVFAGFYIAGCLAAVLAVRQEGLFTAIIQPPLILFCAVPGAYWLYHGRKIGHLKDLLINCGYPLIERFPLMLGTAGAVLLIGLVRWFGMSNRKTLGANTTGDTATATGTKSFISGIVAKLNSYLGIASEEDDADETPSADSKRSRATTRKAAPETGRASRSGRSATRSARTRSRHAQPALEDQDEPMAARPRRRRQAPLSDFDAADPPRRSRRRRRPDGDPDLRAQPPRESRRESRTRRSPYERPAPRSSRFDGSDKYEPPETPERFSRYGPYEPYEPYEAPRRRRATPGGSNGANPTHHPISRVRYRGEGPFRRAKRRAESRATPRTPESITGATPASGRILGVRRLSPQRWTRRQSIDRISRGRANTNVSWAVVTGCTTS
jgi:hypothetical protein